MKIVFINHIINSSQTEPNFLQSTFTTSITQISLSFKVETFFSWIHDGEYSIGKFLSLPHAHTCDIYLISLEISLHLCNNLIITILVPLKSHTTQYILPYMEFSLQHLYQLLSLSFSYHFHTTQGPRHTFVTSIGISYENCVHNHIIYPCLEFYLPL